MTGRSRARPPGQRGRSRQTAATRHGRAQANLPAFAIAVLVVTSTAALALFVADGAIRAADREPLERTRATGLAAAMVDAESPVTERANVVNASRLAALDGDLDEWFPSTRDVAVRIALDAQVLVERGDPTGGTTVRRLVLVAEPQARTIEPAFTGSEYALTLPRRTSMATVDITPPADTVVTTVRANDRVVLHDPEGLAGTYAVRLSRFETVRLAFESTAPLRRGSVAVSYRPTATRKAVLEVTVDE